MGDRDDKMRAIVGVIGDVLGVETDEEISMESAPAWDSLKTLQIVMALEEEGISVPFEKIALIKTARDIAEFAR